MRAEEFRNRRVLVMGLGRFGGGIGVTRWLIEQGARVTVTDAADEDALDESVARLDGLGVSLHLGGHSPADLDNADLLVVNPAVDKVKSEFFQAAVERRVPWTSEMNLFLQRCPSRVVGITGTAGKSTTCAMVHHVLEVAAGTAQVSFQRAWFGGNIGRSLLADLPDMKPGDIVVLELSSFQLEDVAAIKTSPIVGAILNISPNHLDRHGDEQSYLDAKLNIVRYQHDGDIAIAGPNDPRLLGEVVALAERTGARVVQVSTGRTFDLAVAGGHNQTNAACAATVCECLGVGEETARRALRSFQALPHRLQHVRTYEGVEYFNDSKSTTPEATITAVKALEQPAVVIVGGYDKHLPLHAMASALVSRAKAVICCGAAGERYAGAINDARNNAESPYVERVDRLADAVTRARSLASPGDAVLLSPGCSSYDEFANYEFRGQAFMDQVNQWVE